METARQLSLPGTTVRKSNALARAHWPVESVYEPRLVALVASRVTREDVDFNTYQIPVKELLGEEPGGESRRILGKVADNLLNLTLTAETSTGWEKYNLFSYCAYDSSAGTLTLRFDPKLKEHYLGLRRNFTQYELMEFLTLPSIYSQRLFEILRSWYDKPEVTINISELYEMLAVSSYLKARYPDFRREVLDRASKHIHATTSLSYAWEPIKQGRKVVAIRFIFSKPRQGEAEARAKVEQDQRESTAKNALFLSAAKCLGEKGGGCESPEGKKECETCARPEKA